MTQRLAILVCTLAMLMLAGCDEALQAPKANNLDDVEVEVPAPAAPRLERRGRTYLV